MRLVILLLLAVAVSPAQISIVKPYLAPDVPPVRMSNSDRTSATLRGGMLYLSLQDAIALAMDNNLDLASERYGPLLAEWALKRAQAGGPIRGVPSASAQVSSVNNGVGVNGSTASAGLGGGGGGNGGGSSGNASIQQIGAVTPNLDPILQNSTTFSHLTQPLANTVVSGTSALVQAQHTYNTTLQLGLLSGGSVLLRDYEQYLKENAPTDALNPALGPHVDVTVRQNLLRGFGARLNGRSIEIAKLNILAANESLRSQTLNLVANVTNLYWDLVSAQDTVKLRQSAVELARKFRDDTDAKIKAGALAPVELPRAEVELASREQDVLIATTTLTQKQEALRAAILRDIDGPVGNAAIMPLDSIAVPSTEQLPAVRELVSRAMSKRPDVAVTRLQSQAAELAALGTENPLLPSVQVFAQAYNRGVAGQPQPSGGPVDPFFVGGYGTALGQVFRRNFPSESAGVSVSATLNNRQAQGDYGADQLQLRQSAIRGRRDANQIAVEISNQVIALTQARARYSAAVEARALQEQLLTGEQQKFTFGKGTTSGIILAQRALVAARVAEITALATYAHARVSLDQVSGL